MSYYREVKAYAMLTKEFLLGLTYVRVIDVTKVDPESLRYSVLKAINKPTAVVTEIAKAPLASDKWQIEGSVAKYDGAVSFLATKMLSNLHYELYFKEVVVARGTITHAVATNDTLILNLAFDITEL